MEIGRRVRKRREALKLTQEQLAGEVGVTHQAISRVEGGHTSPSAELVIKLSQALGVTCDYLLTGSDTRVFDIKGAIRSDAGLSAQAKRHLIGLIEELRASG